MTATSQDSSMVTERELFDLDIAFGHAAPHIDCCECCEVYCPMEDHDEKWSGDLLYRYTATDGTEYLTDRHIMLRQDLLDAERVKDTMPVPDVAWAVVPDARPALSDKPQGPHVLNACDKYGLTRHESDDPKIVHLYLGDEHVGWTTIAVKPPFIQQADLPVVRDIARKCGLDLALAAKAYLMAREAASTSTDSATSA